MTETRGRGSGAARRRRPAAGVARRPLTLADVLRLPVFERGRPEVLAGDHFERREVRWVHTSEIYEISPLLKGGEVLLTTGLGLVGIGEAGLRDYATSLADRSIAALVLELGRTFTAAPEPLVAVARETNMPLVTLRGIVPFVEITETVHALLLSDEVERLRLTAQIDAAVTAALLSGTGLVALLRELAVFAACPVRLYADDGHLVAASDAADPSTQPPGSDDVTRSRGDDGFPTADVDLMGRRWGRVRVCGSPSAERLLVAQQGATAVALELGRVGGRSLGPGRRRAAAVLLRDLFGRQYSSADEVAGRAAALGLAVRPGQCAVGICLAIDTSSSASTPATSRGPSPAAGPSGTRTGMRRTHPAGHTPSPPTVDLAVAAAAERVFGPVLAAELDGSHLIAACIDGGDLRAVVGDLADEVDAALPAGRAVAVTCGPPVMDIGSLSRSLRVAREASVLARRLHSEMRSLLASDLGVHRLLTRFATDPELAAFVDEQLGPLLDYDAAHGRELVRTLDALLACGMSKAAAARSLHIRRQTLYQRLQTISTLLGGLDLGERERRTSIDLALVGWRLRTAGVPPA